jgi:hypothetical protein
MCTPSRVPTDVSTAQGTECPVGIAHSCSNHSGSLVGSSSGGGGCGGRRLKSKWRRQRLRREERRKETNKQTAGRSGAGAHERRGLPEHKPPSAAVGAGAHTCARRTLRVLPKRRAIVAAHGTVYAFDSAILKVIDEATADGSAAVTAPQHWR